MDNNVEHFEIGDIIEVVKIAQVKHVILYSEYIGEQGRVVEVRHNQVLARMDIDKKSNDNTIWEFEEIVKVEENTRTYELPDMDDFPIKHIPLEKTDRESSKDKEQKIKVKKVHDNNNSEFILIGELATVCVRGYGNIGVAVKFDSDVYVEEIGKALSYYRAIDGEIEVDNGYYKVEQDVDLDVNFVTFTNNNITICIYNRDKIGYSDSEFNGKEIAYFNMKKGGLQNED